MKNMTGRVENFGGGGEYVPQICQLAEQIPVAIFLKVNYEELNAMCHGLHIHVIPFFRFYRGAEGRVRSFGCTIAAQKNPPRDLQPLPPQPQLASNHGHGQPDKHPFSIRYIGENDKEMSLKTHEKDVRHWR
ncbi:thioredoxin-like 1-2, chloroplastic isoform X1 [Rosa rugosa]|uniref:thioredoxin-like 1-2, chloroplastic isoform X1 n=1 Tax=Rosa rugosa TaxID=74645 RepID=UPI002B402242|nr:thioredoxin-like 1-2, chloroplastic isoform X1 [Rosa rugosa]